MAEGKITVEVKANKIMLFILKHMSIIITFIMALFLMFNFYCIGKMKAYTDMAQKMVEIQTEINLKGENKDE